MAEPKPEPAPDLNPEPRPEPKQYDVDSLVKDCVSHHAPSAGQAENIHAIRSATEALILAIIHNCPTGPDRSSAIRKVREAMMTANASIMVPIGSTKF